MEFQRLVEWVKSPNKTIWLCEMENQGFDGGSIASPNPYEFGSVPTYKQGNKLVSVFFNIVESMNTVSMDFPPMTKQAQGNIATLYPEVPTQISMVGWLSFNYGDILKNVLDRVTTEGYRQFERDPQKRKEQLYTWKENRTRLALYGTREKTEDLYLTGLAENSGNKVDHNTNIQLTINLTNMEKQKKTSKGGTAQLNRTR